LATVVKVASPIHDWNFAVSSIGTGGAAGSVLSINAFSLGRIGTVRYSDDYLYATENVITTTRYHSIVISANGKDERLYVDGVKIGSRTSANNQIINAGAYHYIGTSSWNWVYTNQGWYKRMECIWLRQLSDAEAISWTKNPYQFLIPA
jgi:hypothetical protein